MPQITWKRFFYWQLAFLTENFRNKSEPTKDVEQNEHKAVPPTGMFSVDGTKVKLSCAVSSHNKIARLFHIRKVLVGAIYEEQIFRARKRAAEFRKVFVVINVKQVTIVISGKDSS